jgi:hypothetical protein
LEDVNAAGRVGCNQKLDADVLNDALAAGQRNTPTKIAPRRDGLPAAIVWPLEVSRHHFAKDSRFDDSVFTRQNAAQRGAVTRKHLVVTARKPLDPEMVTNVKVKLVGVLQIEVHRYHEPSLDRNLGTCFEGRLPTLHLDREVRELTSEKGDNFLEALDFDLAIVQGV